MPVLADRRSDTATPVRSRVADLDADAPPFARNPSAWTQRLPIVALAVVAAIIAAYLALYQWGLIATVWEPLFGRGSEIVLDSAPSERMRTWFGIPDAAFGAFAYLGDAVFGLAGSTRRWQYRPWLVILFGIDVIPLGIVSIVLVVLQGTVVGSWCTLCLITAVISLLLILLAYDEVWATLQYLRRVWQRTRSARAVWDAFLGRYVAEADEVALVGGRRETHRARTGDHTAMQRAGAWPRVVEIMLALWLAASVFVFSVPSRGLPGVVWAVDLGVASVVILAALACFARRAMRAHLVTLAAGLALAAYGLVQPRPVPPWQQNHIVVGLLLAMFAVIPTVAAAPPRAWQRVTPTPEEHRT